MSQNSFCTVVLQKGKCGCFILINKCCSWGNLPYVHSGCWCIQFNMSELNSRNNFQGATWVQQWKCSKVIFTYIWCFCLRPKAKDLGITKVVVVCGRRPRNYSSCCCCSWIFHLIYALSTSTTVLPPIF